MHARPATIIESILDVAAQEAVTAGFVEITPAHLLISLSRFSEPSQSEGSEAVIQLQREFDHLGIQPRVFRRRLRTLLGAKRLQPAVGTIHRSAACKALFVAAEGLANEEKAPLCAAHLLRAAFCSLGDEGAQKREHSPQEAGGPQVADIPDEL
jgi:hypothetical protein